MRTVNLADDCICCGCDTLASSPAVLMPFVANRVFGHTPIEITSNWGMRDLKSGTSYTPCTSLQCQDCGTLFLDYRFNDDQMAALYTGYRDDVYTQQRDGFEPGYAETVAHDYTQRHAYITDVEAWLAHLLPARPAVLDWGGGDGSNTPFLGRGRIHIHDISGTNVVDGAERILPEQVGEHEYDLVVCSQVLEHVPSPLNLIREIIPALSQQTLLYVEVPHESLMRENPGDLKLATLKRHWHEHVNFFTETGLGRLLERTGLQVVDKHFQSYKNGSRKGKIIGFLAKLKG